MPKKKQPKLSPVYEYYRDNDLPYDIAEGIAQGALLEDYPHCPYCGMIIHGDYGHCIHAFAISCEGEWSFIADHPDIDVLAKQLAEGSEELSNVLYADEQKPKKDKTRIPGKKRVIIRRFLELFSYYEDIDNPRIIYLFEKIIEKSPYFEGSVNYFVDGGGTSSDSYFHFASNRHKMASYIRVELKKLTVELKKLLKFAPKKPAEE